MDGSDLHSWQSLATISTRNTRLSVSDMSQDSEHGTGSPIELDSEASIWLAATRMQSRLDTDSDEGPHVGGSPILDRSPFDDGTELIPLTTHIARKQLPSLHGQYNYVAGSYDSYKPDRLEPSDASNPPTQRKIINHPAANSDSVFPMPEVSRKSDVFSPMQTDSSQAHYFASPRWLPFALRLPFLVSFIVLSTLLSAATLILTVYSSINHGLGIDDGSSTLLFGWRFSPTLIIVLYTLGLTAVAIDVRRTEIFARLAKDGHGASSTYTLCASPGFWWTDIADAFSKQKNGGTRSWVLLFATLGNVLGFLALSPLSAGLLVPKYVNVPSTATFSLLEPPGDIQNPTDLTDEVAFRSLAGGLLNITTSVWITDEFLLRPLWPSSSSMQSSPTISVDVSPQQWQTTTMAYKSALECSPVVLKSPPRNLTLEELGLYNPNSTNYKYTTNISLTHVELGSDKSDCSVSLYIQHGAYGYISSGGGFWTNNLDNITTVSYFSISNASQDCSLTSLLAYYPSWSFNSSFNMNGYLCQSSFLEANVTATVLISETETSISLNATEFTEVAQDMDSLRYPVKQIQDSFFFADWAAYFADSSTVSTSSAFSGPALPIASVGQYNGDIAKLVQSRTLVQEARRFQHQWFGENLLAAQLSNGSVTFSSVQGDISITKRRIVTVRGTGIAMTALLLLEAVLLAAVTILSRLSRRPLELRQDPASIASATSLIASDKSIRDLFHGQACASDKEIAKQLLGLKFGLKNGSLYAQPVSLSPKGSDGPDVEMSTSNKEKPKTTTPKLLRIWMGSILVACLVILIGAIVALYLVSLDHGLYQQALVYQTKLNIADLTTTLAPSSVLPTLIAVGISLWYGAIADALGRVQPFIHMVKRPRRVAHSILVEYANSPVVFGLVKAMRHSHWMLAFAFCGATATKILTVAISALWDLETQTLIRQVVINQQLEQRQVPTMFTAGADGPGVTRDPVLKVVLDDALGNYLTGWMYSAMIEQTQSAPTLAWMRDTWSFTPIDFSLSSDVFDDLSPNITPNNPTSYNITVDAPALRARLDCNPVDYISNKSLWLDTWNFNNATMWNTTNRPSKLDVGYELKTSIQAPVGSDANDIKWLGYSAKVICCANETNGVPGEAAMGYWSENNIGNSIYIVWVVGNPLEGLYNDSLRSATDNWYSMDDRHWIWSEEPKLQVLSCAPIIEQANASITVNIDSGAVWNYTIKDQPKNATGAWTSSVILSSNQSQQNVTYSYGWAFWSAITNAANHFYAGSLDSQWDDLAQSDTDRAFKLRIRGLNADFMSYSMLAEVDNDKHALLDAATLASKASDTLGTFFAHFVSENLNMTSGGWAYQPIGTEPPPSYANGEIRGSATSGAGGSTGNDVRILQLDTPNTTTAYVHIPVQMLIMSPVAVYLSLGVLGLLCAVVLATYAFYGSRFKQLPRDVDTLANTLAFVYKSDELLEWVRLRIGLDNWRDNGIGGAKMASLGPYTSENGEEGWGVELTAVDSAEF